VANLVQSGALGKPQSAMAWRHLTHPAWADWFKDAALSGGEVLDLHIHDLDALNWLFGAPATIYARGTRGPSGGYDHAISLVDYNGVSAVAEGTSLMPAGYPFSMLLTVRCEQGVVEYVLRAGGEQVDSADAGQNSLLVYRPGEAPQPLACTPGDPYALEVAAFVQAAQTGVAPANGTPQQGRLAVATALAARQSIETGAVVTL
jgi:predicted dehydrogenase